MNTTTKSNTKHFSSRIDLPQEAKVELVALLNQQLANTFDLLSQTKHGHWNVKGANFYGTHKMLDELHETVEHNLDAIAERLTALGGVAHGTARQAAEATELAEFPSDVHQTLDVIDHLAKVYAQAANGCREAIDQSDDLGDAGTSDLLTDVCRDLDQAIYLLDAHLQK